VVSQCHLVQLILFADYCTFRNIFKYYPYLFFIHTIHIWFSDLDLKRLPNLLKSAVAADQGCSAEKVNLGSRHTNSHSYDFHILR